MNPNSGPGTPVPDDEYITEMTRLNNYANVRTVGYISTDWSKRALSAVLQDIKTYKAWPEAYAVSGVFFDETSWEYDAKTANFLKTINSAVRHARMGFGQDATVCLMRGRIVKRCIDCHRSFIIQAVFQINV